MPSASLRVDPIDQVVAAFAAGQMVVIADDVDLEWFIPTMSDCV